ncbi:putative ribonuclease H-like domain-containing protein [Tanacetum coccineum]
MPPLFRLTCSGIGSADGAVEFDEADKWDKSALVPVGSKASNSSPIRGTLELNNCNSSASKGASYGSDLVSTPLHWGHQVKGWALGISELCQPRSMFISKDPSVCGPVWGCDSSSPKDVDAAGQHVNTASPEVNTVDPSVNTASHRAIGTKWIFRNKKDERGIVIRNKARLVAQGNTQEEGIDYDEVFAPIARIKAIRLFLAYASFMGFMVYQMDVKSAFLYGQIEEEVYVCQPPGFEDPDYPDKVYKVIDQTLFIKKQKEDILLVQIYVNDIIFGSTKKEMLKQKEDGIFICQDKYVAEILKKFNYTDVKSALTPVDLEKPLVKDGDVDDIDVHLYRSMIGSLMYLIESRPYIMFAVCACARFQVIPKTSHILAVKRIFRYLKGKPTLGLWYSRNSPFELVAYTDSDYARATQDKKSTTGGCQFLRNRLISWQCKKQTVVATSIIEAEYVAAASCYGQVTSEELVKGRIMYVVACTIKSGGSPLKKVGDEAVHKELGDRMERACTSAF